MERISLAKEIHDLHTLVKNIEHDKLPILDPSKYTIFRLDGHKFSNFTKPFDKPYDKDLIQAMIKTSSDLLNYLNASIAYTQSDEITLLIPPCTSLDFNGRRQKLETLSASYCSVRFNYWLLSTLDRSSDLDVVEISTNKMTKIKSGTAHFDCRILQCDEDNVCNIFRWRYLDAFRNGIYALACNLYSHKQLMWQNSKEQIEMVLEKLSEKNIDLDTFDPHLFHGTWIKKIRVKKEFIDNKRLSIYVDRTEIKTWSGISEFKTMEIPNIDACKSKYLMC
jgi:tRNA(His) 5'-end guanylyltransferase